MLFAKKQISLTKNGCGDRDNHVEYFNEPVTSRSRQIGTVAQWLERSTHNRLVAGSKPASPTIFKSLRYVSKTFSLPKYIQLKV